jgi:hypothetical protein
MQHIQEMKVSSTKKKAANPMDHASSTKLRKTLTYVLPENELEPDKRTIAANEEQTRCDNEKKNA